MERRMIVTGWRKSSFSSGNGGNCLEAGNAGPAVAVRDTKQNGAGPILLEPDDSVWARSIRGSGRCRVPGHRGPVADMGAVCG